MRDLMNAAAKKECCSGILHSTQSICPICHKAIEAFYIEEDNKVYFIKECTEHGTFKTLAAENAEDYKKWIKNPVINIPPTSKSSTPANSASAPEWKRKPGKTAGKW